MGRNYSRKDSPASSDLSLIWDSENADWRLTPISGITTVVQSQLTTAVQEPVSQYLTPATGFSITLEGDDDLHLIITPTETLAAGTVVLPVSPGVRDKQLVTVTTSQEITTLTISGNGSSLVGEPATLSLGGFFTLKYDMQTNTWYRVG